jgi:hypothetical protein
MRRAPVFGLVPRSCWLGSTGLGVPLSLFLSHFPFAKDESFEGKVLSMPNLMFVWSRPLLLCTTVPCFEVFHFLDQCW